ncbi:MAG: 1-deoxy-D-xylulose-5-phosphate reductoisomerase [Planctomycetes bacterium]|nr:1-deoxy-D-xylulose-5-phosphate reductoisomerase [Planctomycetota bacterium]
MTGIADGRRRVIVLGSTGSIGVSALDVIAHLVDSGHARLDVVGLAAGSRSGLLAEQAGRLGVAHVAIADASRAGDIAVENVHAGPDAARELVEAVAEPGDLVVGAMVGAAGLPATIAAIDRGCDVALANKETLVAAGALVMPLARQRGVELYPVDSEHSAIAQCLRSGRGIDAVRRIVLTASGGPFRAWSPERIATATPADALSHPTWEMGRKISVDSASMMNKTLEVIEAHWLFGLDADGIEVVVHRQSIVHGFVEFVDGSVVAQLGPPDMRTPIQYALTGGTRRPGNSKRLDWRTLSSLDFEPVDPARFPALGLARSVIEQGGTSGAILNAANEIAVEAFLDERIPFPRIHDLVREALERLPVGPVETLQDVLAADAEARAFVAKSCLTAQESA